MPHQLQPKVSIKVPLLIKPEFSDHYPPGFYGLGLWQVKRYSGLSWHMLAYAGNSIRGPDLGVKINFKRTRAWRTVEASWPYRTVEFHGLIQQDCVKHI